MLNVKNVHRRSEDTNVNPGAIYNSEKKKQHFKLL